MDDQSGRRPGAYQRPGARVIIRTSQGSKYDGRTGTIRRIYQSTYTAMVQLDGRVDETPFGLSGLVSLSSVTRPDWPVDHEEGE